MAKGDITDSSMGTTVIKTTTQPLATNTGASLKGGLGKPNSASVTPSKAAGQLKIKKIARKR